MTSDHDAQNTSEPGSDTEHTVVIHGQKNDLAATVSTKHKKPDIDINP